MKDIYLKPEGYRKFNDKDSIWSQIGMFLLAGVVAVVVATWWDRTEEPQEVNYVMEELK